MEQNMTRWKQQNKSKQNKVKCQKWKWNKTEERNEVVKSWNPLAKWTLKYNVIIVISATHVIKVK